LETFKIVSIYSKNNIIFQSETKGTFMLQNAVLNMDSPGQEYTFTGRDVSSGLLESKELSRPIIIASVYMVGQLPHVPVVRWQWSCGTILVSQARDRRFDSRLGAQKKQLFSPHCCCHLTDCMMSDDLWAPSIL
jgi:hypothetical protein